MAKEPSHKYARQDLKTLLEERNKQNAFFREQLSARVQHAAHLETRLLYTLDTLDELQASSARELQQAQRENAILVEKLNVLQTVLREADREKSDMSNAVLQLVGKVESCGDYSKWQASRIEFSRDISLHPVRPSRPPRASSSNKGPEECTCIQAYSPAIIEELSDSLAREKRAHALTTEEAERRIAALQSRIAVRDAEIARRAATCRCLPTSSAFGSSAHLQLMSEEEQARVAARTAQTNRTVGSEVASLDNKVRRQRRSHLLVDCSTQTEPPNLMHHPLTNNPPTTRPIVDDDRDPVPTALNTLDAQIIQLRQQLTDIVTEKEALRHILYHELGIQDPGPSESPGKQRHFEPVGPVDESRDVAISGMGASRPNEETRGFEDILLLEEECIRLMHSEDDLRSSLDSLRQRNARLKDELSRLRNGDGRIVEQPSPLSLPPLDTSAIDMSFPPLQPDIISPLFMNEDDESEDRAPGPSGWARDTDSSSSVSSSNSPVTPTSAIEPSEVPLPRTPTFDDAETELSMQEGEADETQDESGEPRSPPLPFAALSSPPGIPPEPTPAPPPLPLPPDTPAPNLSPQPPPEPQPRDQQTIERELAHARADAEVHEREIAEVQEMMADLALRIGSEFQGS